MSVRFPVVVAVILATVPSLSLGTAEAADNQPPSYSAYTVILTKDSLVSTQPFIVTVGVPLKDLETPKPTLASTIQPSKTSQNDAGGVFIDNTVKVSTDSEKQRILSLGGVEPSDYVYATYIMMHESGFSSTAEEPHTHAFGVCQSLPGNKMASAGSDWKTNIITQVKWCNQYAVSRYGSWGKAYSFWIANRWW